MQVFCAPRGGDYYVIKKFKTSSAKLFQAISKGRNFLNFKRLLKVFVRPFSS